jgi:hypothetical protein
MHLVFIKACLLPFKDGQKISIQLAAPDHETNEIIQAVFDSVEIL